MARSVACVGGCMHAWQYSVHRSVRTTRTGGTSHMLSIAKTVHVCEEGCVWLVGSRGTTGANGKRSWLFHGMRQATRPHLAHWTSSTCCINAGTRMPRASNNDWQGRALTTRRHVGWCFLSPRPPPHPLADISCPHGPGVETHAVVASGDAATGAEPASAPATWRRCRLASGRGVRANSPDARAEPGCAALGAP